MFKPVNLTLQGPYHVSALPTLPHQRLQGAALARALQGSSPSLLQDSAQFLAPWGQVRVLSCAPCSNLLHGQTLKADVSYRYSHSAVYPHHLHLVSSPSALLSQPPRPGLMAHVSQK